MLRQFILLILMCLFTGLTRAQNPDSLYTIWQDQTQQDSTRVNAFQEYIWNGYIFSKPDSALGLANELQEYAEKQNYPRAQAVADYTRSAVMYLRGDYARALEFNTKSIELSESIDAKKMTASNLNMFGLIFEKQGVYSKALHYHQRSLMLSEEINDKRGVAFSLNNIGEILEAQGNSVKALDNFERSLTILEGLDMKRYVAGALANIGTCYTNLGNYSLAFDFYQRSLNDYEEIDDKLGIIQTLHMFGRAYYQQKDTIQALTYFQESLKMSREIDYPRGAVLSLTDIGRTYYDLEKYSQALAYCQESYKLSKEMGAMELQKDACDCIYSNYKATDNKAQALAYLEELNRLDDSLGEKETAKILQRMDFERTMLADSIAKAEEARLVEEAHKEEMRNEEKNRNISMGIGSFFILLAGGFYSRWRYVKKSKAKLQEEKDRSDNLLLNILPEEVARELKEKGKAEARHFDSVSILFTDFKGFTEQSTQLSAAELVNELNQCYEAFDGIVEKYNIEKIKTIGDAYMAAGGLPVQTSDSLKNTVLATLEMQDFITRRKAERDAKGEPAFEMRVGIHTGPVVAGIVGVKKFQYDIWGDTVNTASRMESSGEVGKVNISETTYELLKEDANFAFERRGMIEVKGKGKIEMYFVAKQ
ncbi:MAG: tetratricopeptide repeat protein [Bacteroidetes bacterium]|nr:tetratricopeptide repeat protein [Bacteroidota bacterium]